MSQINTNSLSTRSIVFLFIAAFIVAAVAAAAIFFIPLHMNKVEQYGGPVVAENTTTHIFLEDEESGNKQLGLGLVDKITQPASFIFTNGFGNNQKVVDIYLDFNESRSRDVILLNQSLLSGLIEEGRIELHVHAVFTDDVFSLYAPEALAHMFAEPKNKARAWDTFIDVLLFGTEYAQKDFTAEGLAIELSSLVNEGVGAESVSAQDIQSGSFHMWLRSVFDSPQLAERPSLPSVFVDDTFVNLTSNDLSVSDDFFELVGKGK